MEEAHVKALKNPFEAMLNDHGPVEPVDLLSRESYEAKRSELLTCGRHIKEKLRISLGESFSLLFETRATAWLQIHEELRWMAKPDPKQVAEILARYNTLLPNAQGISACLFLDTRDPVRARRMIQTVDIDSMALRIQLNESLLEAQSMELNGGALESVNYLRFSETCSSKSLESNCIQWSAPKPSKLLMPDYLAEALLAVFADSLPAAARAPVKDVAFAPVFV